MSGRYVISNGVLDVAVLAKGGQLDRLAKDGVDYLWRGDARYWGDKAPNLFPYIARLVDGTYTLDGKEYQLDIHGFVKDCVLSCAEVDGALVCTLASNEATRVGYPFDFVYRVCYRLDGATLAVTYEVENHSGRDMYFGIGGHPGFNVPLEPNLAFEDYTLTFDAPATPRRVLFSADCFVAGCQPYTLQDCRALPLRHDLFDDDAIVLSEAAKCVTLASHKGSRSVTVRYADFDYIGFWHLPQRDAPYVCIEPWSSLPARAGTIEDLATQPGLINLQEGGFYRNEWTITLE